MKRSNNNAARTSNPEAVVAGLQDRLLELSDRREGARARGDKLATYELTWERMNTEAKLSRLLATHNLSV